MIVPGGCFISYIRRPIIFGYAGDPQVIICAAGTTLKARIWGGPVEKATYHWEQLSGPTVTWTSPINGITATFLKNEIDPYKDVQFRFWINKDSDIFYKKFSDVWIYSTPLSSSRAAGYSASTFNAFINNNINDFPIDQLSVEIVTGFSIDTYMLNWKYPATPANLLDTIIQKLVNGVWVNIGTAPRYSNTFGPVDRNQNYRIIVTKDDETKLPSNKFLVTSNLSQYASPPAVRFPEGSLPPYTTMSSSKAINSISINSNTFTAYDVQERTLSLLGPNISSGIINGNTFTANSNTITGHNVLERTLLDLNVSNIPSTGRASFSFAFGNTITNYTVSQLGGVVIGG